MVQVGDSICAKEPRAVAAESSAATPRLPRGPAGATRQTCAARRWWTGRRRSPRLARLGRCDGSSQRSIRDRAIS